MTRVLQAAPLLLLMLVVAVFSTLSPRFFEVQNFSNILVQASSLAIVASGMTFVLLTAGIDLSAGSIMFVSAAVAGKLVLSGAPLWAAIPAVLAAGVGFGLVNAAIISGLRMLPFVVTLSTMYAGRGLALWMTDTRAMNLPEELLRVGAGRVAGVPVPVCVLAVVLAGSWYVLSRTAYGRHIYAIGNNVEAARTAGLPVRRIVGSVYVISGMLAAVGGLVSVAQLGAVSPTFGSQREFAAIAAAVLGGTSLFGGRGNVFPGTLLGAVLIQAVESGLVMSNANPYVYPMVLAGIIFAAVLCDGIRQRQVEKRSRRTIRPLAGA